MSRMTAAVMAGALVLVCARTSVQAQAKVIPGEHHTMKATVEAIEMPSRLLTVRTEKGELHTVQAPAQSQRLSEVKVGDTVNLTYYDNIIIRMKQANEPDVDTLQAALTPGGGSPGVTAAAQQTITATVTSVDMNAPSIAFKGPRGWSYASKVQDKKALQQVKVGDRVDITWTAATLVSVAPSGKTPAVAPVKK